MKGIVCFVYFALLSCYVVEAVLPNYTPASGRNEGLTQNELIKDYFKIGLSGPEIIVFLKNVHGIFLSLRQLKRILRALGCRRRKDRSDFQEVVEAVEKELSGSGSIIGYRAMHRRLISEYGLVVRREDVRRIIQILDPDGVEMRSRHRLRRRLYMAKGPNYLWHVDGYDKLKPFGFCIHGCIDGYSRRILWLEVAYSNNDPRIVGRYFLDYVKEIEGTARIIRGDRGTENGNIEIMQRFFRELEADDFAGDKSFMYGRSTSNQRIEAWWGNLRKSCSDWWIRYFKDMRDSGLYQDDKIIHQECLRFCYMDVLQNELNRVATQWNTHRIRPSNNSESPSGRPDVNYFYPTNKLRRCC
jgi:hypothetical protein